MNDERVDSKKNLQNFRFLLAKLFLLSKLLDSECNLGDALIEAIVGFLLEFCGRFLRLIDDSGRFTNDTISKLLLVARET